MAWYNPVDVIKGGVNAGSGAVHWLGGIADESQSAIDKRNALNGVGVNANAFASALQQQAAGLGAEAQQNRQGLQAIANGQNSVSAEQLRQGLQQNLAAQRSMAAGASPGNSALAARSAALGIGRAGTAMSGQQAVAGLAERQAAQQALSQQLTSLYGTNVSGAIGAQGNAVNAYGGVTPDKSTLDKWAGAVTGAAAVAFK